MSETDTWSKINYKVCKPYNIPSNKTLYIKNSLEDEWIKSHHKWCIGCYNSYKLICKEVSKLFNIPITNIDKKLWDEQDLMNMVNKIYNETKNDNYETWLNENEPKMKALIECINTRYFHHSYCYKSDKKERISTKSTTGHMRNLTVLCSSLLKLYIIYEKKLKDYNDNSLIKKKNLLLDLNTECADNCRNSLKRDDDKDLKKIFIELKLKPKNINKLETKSPRSYSSPKRSRRTSSYKVKNDKMKKIIDNYINRLEN
jgi:hypothetical protein